VLGKKVGNKFEICGNSILNAVILKVTFYYIYKANNSLLLSARDSVKVSTKIGMAILYDQPSVGSE
jgi:hypothetical protein